MSKKKEDPEKDKNTEGNGSSEGNGDGDGGDGGSDDMVTMSQEALNTQFSERAARASRTAVDKLLKGVGFEDVDGLKEALKTFKDYQDSKKTEGEKLQGDLETAQTAITDLTDANALAVAQVKELVMKGAVMEAARGLNFLPESSQDIWLLIQSDSGLSKMIKFDEDTLKVTGADKVAKEVAKQRPHWVQKVDTRLTPGGRKKGGKTSQNSKTTEEEREAPFVHF